MKRLFIALLGFCIVLTSSAQNWNIDWYSSAYFLGGTGSYLPFWQRTGNNGILPNTSSGTLTLGADLKYHSKKGWFFETGANLAGSAALKNSYNPHLISGLVDRLYISGGWKMLRLDVGMLPYSKDLGDLSLSGGNFMWSANARNIPGIDLKLDWLYFEKGHWFGIKANFGHYQFIDNRSTKGTMLHDKSIAIKVACGRKLDLILGIEHLAQWGGIMPNGHHQPDSFKDYLRVVVAKKGDGNATHSDQVNVLGNHLGREFIRFVWHPKDFTMTFQYDKPFEDGSSKRLQNMPDGLWSLKFSMNDRKGPVTDFVLEHLTTLWQSGPHHDIPIPQEEIEHPKPNASYRDGKKILGGCDDYFNNGEYRSGWTNYGRVIGMPLFTPTALDENGISHGIVNNRVSAFHFGMAGNVVDGVPYSLKTTYSKNYGRYHESKESFFYFAPWQLSLGLEFSFEKAFTKLPVIFALGAYADFGELYKNGGGLTFRIIYRGSRRF